MTWRELFRRAWLVLRLRFKRFHVCEECGDVMQKVVLGSYAGSIIEWDCPACALWGTTRKEREQLEWLLNTPPGVPIRIPKGVAIVPAIVNQTLTMFVS